jgi:hypothetical protein
MEQPSQQWMPYIKLDEIPLSHCPKFEGYEELNLITVKLKMNNRMDLHEH